jgi:hypothetical protein
MTSTRPVRCLHLCRHLDHPFFKSNSHHQSSTTNPSSSNSFTNPLPSFIPRQTPLHRGCWWWASPVEVSAK